MKSDSESIPTDELTDLNSVDENGVDEPATPLWKEVPLL